MAVEIDGARPMDRILRWLFLIAACGCVLLSTGIRSFLSIALPAGRVFGTVWLCAFALFVGGVWMSFRWRALHPAAAVLAAGLALIASVMCLYDVEGNGLLLATSITTAVFGLTLGLWCLYREKHRIRARLAAALAGVEVVFVIAGPLLLLLIPRVEDDASIAAAGLATLVLGESVLRWKPAHAKRILGSAAGGAILIASVWLAARAHQRRAVVPGGDTRPVVRRWLTGPDLLKACVTGEHERVRQAIADGVPLEWKNDDGETALIKAAAALEAGVVEILLQAGASVNATDEAGRTPLIRAVASTRTFGLRELVQLLVWAGANVRHRDRHGATALHYFAAQGTDAETVRLLLRSGAIPNAEDACGVTPVSLALNAPSFPDKGLDIPRLLLSTGEPHGAALALAALMGSRPGIERRLSQGDDPNVAVRGYAPLYLALIGGKLAKYRDEDDYVYPTPADWKKSTENAPETLSLLLEHGADPNAPNGPERRTALTTAASRGRRGVVKLMLRHGANVDAADAQSRTALILAVRNWEMVKLLIASGASVNAQDDFGDTPLMKLSEGYQMEPAPVRQLLSLHPDLNLRNRDGQTALDRAESDFSGEIPDLLRRAGARHGHPRLLPPPPCQGDRLNRYYR